MKRILNPLSHYLASVPDKVRNKKILVGLIAIAITVASFMGMPRLRFDFTLEGWFSQDDPTFVAFNELHDQFGSEDGLLIAYKPKDGDVFTAKSLEVVKGIRDELINYRDNLKEGEDSALERIVKVKSLINAPVLTVKGDLLLSKWLVGETVPTSPEALEKIRKIALSQKDFPLQYFSEDMKYGSIFIETDFGAIPWDHEEEVSGDIIMDEMIVEDNDTIEEETPRFKPTDMADYRNLNSAVKEILSKPEYADHLEYYAVGNTAGSEANDEMGKEMGMLYLMAILIMIALLWFLFRSVSGILWALLIVALTTIWTFGIAGLFGSTITTFVILTFFLLLTVGMADAIHIISGYLFFRNEGNDHESSIRSAFRKSGVSCLLTSVTTMIGLLALCMSDIVPIRIFALMSAGGVAIAFLLTIYLLPVMLELWSPVKKIKKDQKDGQSFFGRIFPNFALKLQKILEKIVPAVEKRPLIYILPFFLIFVISVFGAFKVKVDTDLTGYFPEESNFNKSVKIMDEKMAGSSRIALYLDVGQDHGLEDPRVLKVIEELEIKLKEKYSKYVVTTSSIVNVVKDAYQTLNEGREENYIIPSDARVLSQTLFMFNGANPEDRKRVVDDNYRKANITITLHNFGSYEYNKVFAQMKEDIQESANIIKQDYPETFISITGIFALSMRTAEYLTVTALDSFSTALFVICLMLFLLYGSFKAGLVSIIPNLLPSILTFGLLGLLDIPLDFYTMMLAPIIIGISVDDTIHFLTQYRFQYSIDGDIKTALKKTLKETGQGIMFTSLILGLGFGIMSVSTYTATANIGIFGALAIFTGLLNDLFLLPALIIVSKLTFRKEAE